MRRFCPKFTRSTFLCRFLYEYVAPSPDEFRRRIAEIGAFYPYPVCELDGRIAGYAYAHRYHERAAYAWDAELSVYVDKITR